MLLFFKYFVHCISVYLVSFAVLCIFSYAFTNIILRRGSLNFTRLPKGAIDSQKGLKKPQTNPALA